MYIRLLLILGISFGTAASVLAAPVVVCESGTWAEVPMLQAGVFVGSIQSSCDISESTDASTKLGQHFQNKINQGVIQVYEGPVLDATLGVPAVHYDQRVRTPEGEIRNFIRFGGNGTDLYVYSSHSKEVNFSGTARYLSRLDIDFRIERLPNHHLKVTLINLTNVQKPRFVPVGIFLSMAKSRSLSQFQASLENLGKEVGESL